MARSPKAGTADILAEFPGPVTLRPSKLHLVHMFVVSIFFFVGGIFFFQAPRNSSFDRAVLIGCTIMGGLGAPMIALAFLPSAAFLRLDGAGFEYVNIFRGRQFAWSNVKDFGVWVGPYGVRCVSFKAAWRGHFFRQLLPDTYGFTVEETAALMDSWRSRAIPSSVGQTRDDGQGHVPRRALKLGGNFAHVTTLQWVGLAIIGLSMVAALVVFFTSIRAPQLSETTDPVLSDHGPKRVACDSKWSTVKEADPGSYRQFLHDCMILEADKDMRRKIEGRMTGDRN